jgi:hypothetical protein
MDAEAFVDNTKKRPALPHGPSGIGCVPSPFVTVPSGPSKTYRRLLLAVSNSTINQPSEYMILTIPLFCDHLVFFKRLQNSLSCQGDQDQIQDSAMVGTNCRLQNSPPAGYSKQDLAVLRQIRCPLRNNLLQGQRSLRALLLVTQLVRCAFRKRQNNGQAVKHHCSKDPPFSLSIDLVSLDVFL